MILIILLIITIVIVSGVFLRRVPYKDIFKGTWGQGEAYDPVKQRINFYGNEVFINNSSAALNMRDVTMLAVFKLKGNNNEIVFYENTRKIKNVTVISLDNTLNLDGWYLHTSIRITKDAEIQMKGVLSKNADQYNIDTDERITFEPFTI